MTSEEDVPDAWNRRQRPPRPVLRPLHRPQGQRAAGSLLAAHAESAMADSACGVPKRCLWTPFFIQKFWYGSYGWGVRFAAPLLVRNFSPAPLPGKYLHLTPPPHLQCGLRGNRLPVYSVCTGQYAVGSPNFLGTLEGGFRGLVATGAHPSRV